MNCSSLLVRECLKFPLQSLTVEAAVEELVGAAEAAQILTEPAQLSKSVLSREKTRHTYLGDGIVVPRGAARGVSRHFLAVGVFQEPVAYKADKVRSVRHVVLFGSFLPKHLDFLKLLACVVRVLSDQNNRELLKGSGSEDDLYNNLQTIFDF
jgi:mannitol/fructose-specific phosphotransferase system IIA component (Ntr-type)